MLLQYGLHKALKGKLESGSSKGAKDFSNDFDKSSILMKIGRIWI